MRQSPLLALVPAAIVALLLTACRDHSAALVPPVTPPSLSVPAGQKLVLAVLGKGDQIYRCSAKPGSTMGLRPAEPGSAPYPAGALEWVLESPKAELFDERGQVVGEHYVGPTWEAIDGSKVVGQVKAKADAPDQDAIPWLLIEVTANVGAGVLAKVKSVQRVDTWGGKAPKEGCDATHAGAESRVGYRARYYFYEAAGG
jgi:Protein of unknown function (DUF3455)